jgi:predicted dinucleotide-utilizing enzyme
VTTVLLVGAGAVGTRTARQLVDTPGVTEVLLADADRDRAERVAEAMEIRAVRWAPDERVPSSVDVVLCAVPAAHDLQVVDAAIAAGVPVAACTDDEATCAALLERDRAARDAGVTVAVGAGFVPGLVDVLVRHAADSLDVVEEAHVALYGVAGPACAHQRHHAARSIVREWRSGTWVTKRPGSARELVWFPEPVGSKDCYRVASGAAPLLVRTFPDLQRVTVRAAARRRDRLLARLPMLISPASEGGWGGLRVEVRGRRGASRELQVLGAVDRMAVATGTVLGVTGLVLAGLVPAGTGPEGAAIAGAHGLGQLVAPVPFLAELDRRGLRAATYEGART